MVATQWIVLVKMYETHEESNLQRPSHTWREKWRNGALTDYIERLEINRVYGNVT